VNKNKSYVLIFVAFMLATSLVVSLIMTFHFQQDTSKLRFELTQKYKEIKDQEYTYDKKRGKALYQDLCMKCHGEQGRGNSIYPPLYASEIALEKNPKKLIKVVTKGLQGKIKRQNKLYQGAMPAFGAIPAKDLAHILNFTRKTFGDPKHTDISAVDVIKIKIDTVERTSPWEEKDL
tara:strand:- start:6028 stop:6558 length:531 start_codon:yes stop_codon:yes gene_type:complete